MNMIFACEITKLDVLGLQKNNGTNTSELRSPAVTFFINAAVFL